MFPLQLSCHLSDRQTEITAASCLLDVQSFDNMGHYEAIIGEVIVSVSQFFLLYWPPRTLIVAFSITCYEGSTHHSEWKTSIT